MKKEKKKNKGKTLTKQFHNILNHLVSNKDTAEAISNAFSIDKNDVDREIKRLQSSEYVIHTINKDGNEVYTIDPDKVHTGIISITSNGNGYVNCGDSDDIFIYADRLNRAFDGDAVTVVATMKGLRRIGEIVNITKRNKVAFIGTMDRREKFGYVVSKNAKMYTDIYIPKNFLMDSKTNDVVVVEFTKWDDAYAKPHGKVTNVIGESGKHETELHAILSEYGFPYTFPQDVLDEAALIDPIIHQSEIDKRRDLRNTISFVIDPIGARDKDDAISFEDLGNGVVEIGVHIADITHYVNEDTKLYEEAFNRATSVYLVDRCVPMFPEVLSNNICSLHPNEDKLAFSVLFKFDKNGGIIDKWFGKTIIHIDRDYSYEAAYEVLISDVTNDEIEVAIKAVDAQAKILRERRMQNNTLIFNKSEIKFKLDENDLPISVYEKKQNVANYLIEEFMLLANESVGQHIYKSIKRGLFRHHPAPTLEKVNELANLCKQFGYKFDENNVKESINALMEEIKDTPEENLLNTLAIRTMQKAVYSATDKGHWGLGDSFGHYSHFTSPIRRFSDIKNHQLLSVILNQERTKTNEIMLKSDEICEHINRQEKLATSAERDSIKYMQIKYLEARKDQIFDAVISGISEYNLYVELVESKCEGSISTKSLNGHFHFDSKTYSLINESAGISYRLGDKIMVKVTKTDLLKKQIDLIPV